jgi:hypothetical protein
LKWLRGASYDISPEIEALTAAQAYQWFILLFVLNSTVMVTWCYSYSISPVIPMVHFVPFLNSDGYVLTVTIFYQKLRLLLGWGSGIPMVHFILFLIIMVTWC